MSERQDPSGKDSTPQPIEYASSGSSGKRSSPFRILGIVLLVLLGVGILIFGICTYSLMHS